MDEPLKKKKISHVPGGKKLKGYFFVQNLYWILY